jgi:DUF1009 family protein
LTPDSNTQRLGFIAGQGRLAAIAARHLRAGGHTVMAVGFDRETAAAVAGAVDSFHLLRFGQLGKLISAFQNSGVRSVLMLGKIHKTIMYRKIRPDRRALRLWKKIRDRRDDTILKILVAELQTEGITVEKIDRFLGHLLAPAGKISSRAPDRRETVAVRDRAPVAIEAIEGTDQAILRGGTLAGPGTVVVKVSKPQQDFRFDVPVVGLETVRSLAAAKASAMAFEAGKTLFVEREEALPLLRRHRIAVYGYRNSDFV